MGNGSRKQNTNVYFRARKEASAWNDRLSSREGAAELLGLSESTLSDYELGNTKVVPVDKVVLMAELYNCPELENLYCKNECPIGKNLPIATEYKGIEGVVLRLIQELSTERVYELKKNLIQIAQDGQVTLEEKGMLELMLRWTSDMEAALSSLRLTARKIMGE